MLMIDYESNVIDCNEDLLRGVIALVSKNYVDEYKPDKLSAVSLKDCLTILFISVNIIDDLIEVYRDYKISFSTKFKFKLELKGKYISISQKALVEKTGDEFLSYLGLVSFSEMDTMTYINSSVNRIYRNMTKLKQSLSGMQFLGLTQLDNGNIVDYLTKVKYIVDKYIKYSI